MKKITYNIVLLVSILFLASCSDLNQYPLNGPSADTYLTNETELMEALNSAYSANSYDGPLSSRTAHFLALEQLSDIGFDRSASGIPELSSGNADPNNVYARDVWKDAYFAISKCNFLITNMHRAKDNVPEKRYNEIEAEARVIRAYTYHYLVELYGDVPLVTKMLTLDEANTPRSPKSEVADYILNELEESASMLPDDYNGTGRVSKTTALAIKARTALYNERWDIAAKAAKAVIDLNVHDLDDSYSNLFLYNGQNSKEVIWAAQYVRAANKTHGTCRNFGSRNGKGHSNKVPSQSLVDAYQCIDGKDIDKTTLYNPKKPYENRDPRMAYTLALPGSIFMNYQFETHKDSVKCWDYTGAIPKRITNEDATNAYATFTGYCWKKYVDEPDFGDPVNSEINLTVIRYAEVLLIYAEAKIEANDIDQTVYNAINKVRQRPSVNMPAIPSDLSQTELRSAVRRERLYELAGEGLRLFDIRRWKLAETVLNKPLYGRVAKGLLKTAPIIDENGIPDYSQVPNKDELRVVENRSFNIKRDYLWPISQREMTANKALVQNPEY